MDWRPLFCGLCFGIYPILSSRSKLSSGAMLWILSVIMVVFAITPFLQNGLASIKMANSNQMSLMLVSALASAIGVLVMFRYLADTPIEKAGTLVVIMVVTQIVVTMATASTFAKTLPSGQQVLGVVMAIGAIFLLSPK